MSIDIKLSNPKTFLPLLLFLGVVLVLIGTVANAGLATDGWIVVAISVLLWILSSFSNGSKRNKT